MKYKVLLVDDEEEVSQAIKRKLDWDEIGFEIPEYAHNGLEALEFAEDNTPDVVMTDIQMPYMTGLELSKKLKQLYPGIRIIIFSGYDEFEYAKEAIRLEAEEYILKPIDAEELKNVFTRIRESLDKERDDRQNLEKLQSYYMESLPLLQEDFFAALLDGKVDEKRIDKYIKDYQIDLKGPYYCTAIIHASTTDLPEGMSHVLLSVSVRRLAEEKLSPMWNAKFFSYLGNTVAIAQFDNENEIIKFTDECDRFCRLALSVCKANVTVGIGPVVSSVDAITTSYSGAKDALSYRVLYGTTKAINISEIAPAQGTKNNQDNEADFHDIFKKIKMEDEEALLNTVENYVMQSTRGQMSVQDYRFFVIDIIGELYRFIKGNQIDPEKIFETGEDIYATVSQLDKNELINWLKASCKKLQQIMREKRTDTTKSFVGKAIEYVEDHYADQDLSVDRICMELSVSSAYFSTVFKKETGRTFVTYLTDYRMEKALQLLIEKDEKTYVIAQQVGYADPNYFSYVFKKQFGTSPSKYKQGLTGDGNKKA
ncbi:response regulator [Butyrivibrio sp. NC2002]|uniref:response regulator n=1 Tax=Butyrivibrio sp. NC2002 TaxID=1410610 RepID=UPI0005679AE4|nr:response regulator [Butyrivibrio sp. NC2002]